MTGKQVYLDKPLVDWIKSQARPYEKSLAGVVRRLLYQAKNKEAPVTGLPNGNNHPTGQKPL